MENGLSVPASVNFALLQGSSQTRDKNYVRIWFITLRFLQTKHGIECSLFYHSGSKAKWFSTRISKDGGQLYHVCRIMLANSMGRSVFIVELEEFIVYSLGFLIVAIHWNHTLMMVLLYHATGNWTGTTGLPVGDGRLTRHWFISLSGDANCFSSGATTATILAVNKFYV